jgi:hypothetical protein
MVLVNVDFSRDIDHVNTQVIQSSLRKDVLLATFLALAECLAIPIHPASVPEYHDVDVHLTHQDNKPLVTKVNIAFLETWESTIRSYGLPVFNEIIDIINTLKVTDDSECLLDKNTTYNVTYTTTNTNTNTNLVIHIDDIYKDIINSNSALNGVDVVTAVFLALLDVLLYTFRDNKADELVIGLYRGIQVYFVFNLDTFSGIQHKVLLYVKHPFSIQQYIHSTDHCNNRKCIASPELQCYIRSHKTIKIA